VPAILVTGYDDDETLRQASAPHVFGYLVKPIKARDLAPAIKVAMAHFALHRAAEREAAGLRQALEERKLVERAKGAVMRRLAVDEADAFRRMRKLSSERNWRLIELAREVLKSDEIFEALDRSGGPR